jgi:molybdate transport system substrate-binding protein
MPAELQSLKGISSMATRLLLAQLAELYERDTGQRVEFTSVGGVDAEKRVMGGELFDIVMLASDAMERLAASGKIDRDSLTGVVTSSIAVAVRPGMPAPDIHDENSIRDAVLNARAVGYSTGPSGRYILRLLEKWGVPTGDGAASPRPVQARPGIPVGSLVASGEVDIGFQQLSELLHVDGINLLGPLPDPIQMTTTFSAAMGSAARDRQATKAFLAFLVSPAANPTKAANGMAAG